MDGIKGKIVNIGDWATERPYKDYLPYLVAKGGLTTMTLALAKELAPHVPVAMIQPAMIDPPRGFHAGGYRCRHRPDPPAPRRHASGRQPANPLLPRGNQLRHRRLLPRRRRPVPGTRFMRTTLSENFQEGISMRLASRLFLAPTLVLIIAGLQLRAWLFGHGRRTDGQAHRNLEADCPGLWR